MGNIRLGLLWVTCCEYYGYHAVRSIMGTKIKSIIIILVRNIMHTMVRSIMGILVRSIMGTITWSIMGSTALPSPYLMVLLP